MQVRLIVPTQRYTRLTYLIWVDGNGRILRCMHAYIIFPWIGRHPAGTYTEICPSVTIAAPGCSQVLQIQETRQYYAFARSLSLPYLLACIHDLAWTYYVKIKIKNKKISNHAVMAAIDHTIKVSIQARLLMCLILSQLTATARYLISK